MSVKTGERCPNCGQVRTEGEVKVPGIYTIEYNGEKWEVPALNVKTMRWAMTENVWKVVEEKGEDSEEGLAVLIDLIHRAMRRNYPDLQKDELEEMIDFSNLVPIVAALRGFSIPPAGSKVPLPNRTGAEETAPTQDPVPTPTSV